MIHKKTITEFDNDLNLALLKNLRLKAIIISFILGFVITFQLFIFAIFSFGNVPFFKTISINVGLYAPLLILCALIANIICIHYFNNYIKNNKLIPSHFSHFLTFVEVSFPSLILITLFEMNKNMHMMEPLQLLNTPPAFFYFIMILLSSLLLEFKLSIFSGIVGGIEYAIISYTFVTCNPLYDHIDLANQLSKAGMMVVAGIIAGLISKQIKEATLSSLQAKNDLINNLDRLVDEKTSEILIQKDEISQKNKDITDSIHYAKRIQEAKLPKRQDISIALPHSFILFRPKDIVSGDFYFFQQKANSIFIAAADCTGHGVPGAFMSMLGSEKLEEALLHFSDTSEILKYVNKKIKDSLHQNEGRESTKDGMDLAICSIDIDKMTLQFSGANRPLWIIRKGMKVVEEIKATRKAIGGYTDEAQHFESHEVKLNEGDSFYIFSDGFADTFSGQEWKKLTTKKFKELLLNIQDLPMLDQEYHLDHFLEEWKGGTEQVDDILVIGVRV